MICKRGWVVAILSRSWRAFSSGRHNCAFYRQTDNNAMTKHVLIGEGGFGNRTGHRGTGGGSNPAGGEYTEAITGRVTEEVKFSTFGGGGGAGIFSALEWVMKGAVWLVLVLFVCAGYRAEQRSYGRVRMGWGYVVGA